MSKSQSHRGFDGEGSWMGQIGKFQLGFQHRRLAILDLTSAGNQPMISPNGRYILVFNGEIYNYRDLRRELELLGHRFQSTCDTEVLLHALMAWGEAAFPKLIGMWALVFVDVQERTAIFSRDRIGVKPLYLYQGKDTLVFASEIKAILVGLRRKFSINSFVVSRFLEQSLLDAQPETFFEGIESIVPNTFLKLDLSDQSDLRLRTSPYYSFPTQVAKVIDVEESIQMVREAFLDAVRCRLQSDVPVGILLSGGLDSSSIAGAMHHLLGKSEDFHILSAVSDDERFDESPFIHLMAQYLQRRVNKIPLHFSPAEAFQYLEAVTWMNDEPVTGFSAVAQYLLMERAKELGVGVVLSGQGGDELFCGYKKYFGFYLQSLLRSGNFFLATQTFIDLYKQKTILNQIQWGEIARYIPGVFFPFKIDIRGPALKNTNHHLDIGLGNGTVSERQLLDIQCFSAPAILHFEDRMSMAFTREIRLPFFDHRMIDIALSLAPEWKMRNGWTKWIFRKAMEPYLPPEITWRRDKQGFSNPEEVWFKKKLRGKVESMLYGELLIAKKGLVNQKALQERFSAYAQQKVGGAKYGSGMYFYLSHLKSGSCASRSF